MIGFRIVAPASKPPYAPPKPTEMFCPHFFSISSSDRFHTDHLRHCVFGAPSSTTAERVQDPASIQSHTHKPTCAPHHVRRNSIRLILTFPKLNCHSFDCLASAAPTPSDHGDHPRKTKITVVLTILVGIVGGLVLIYFVSNLLWKKYRGRDDGYQGPIE